MAIDQNIIVTKSEAETIAFAQKCAAQIDAGDIILLYGDLGMGKSVFCRAMIRALCGHNDMDVPSPTFTLVQTYDASIGMVWHFDLYRISVPEEIYEIGWEEAMIDDVLLVEWPSRLAHLMPSRYYKIDMTCLEGENDHRKIEVTRHG